MHLRRRIIAAVGLIWLGTAAAVAEEAVARVGTYGAWSLLTDDNAPHLFCFVTSEAKESAPKAERDVPRAYISAWPKDGIRGEVSFRFAAHIEQHSDVTASIRPNEYTLFTNGDRAFVKDPTQELKLLDAMRKGHVLTVAFTAEDGGQVSDTYSLSGVGVALQTLQDTCF
jgi:hypothetical protein